MNQPFFILPRGSQSVVLTCFWLFSKSVSLVQEISYLFLVEISSVDFSTTALAMQKQTQHPQEKFLWVKKFPPFCHWSEVTYLSQNIWSRAGKLPRWLYSKEKKKKGKKIAIPETSTNTRVLTSVTASRIISKNLFYSKNNIQKPNLFWRIYSSCGWLICGWFPIISSTPLLRSLDLSIRI